VRAARSLRDGRAHGAGIRHCEQAVRPVTSCPMSRQMPCELSRMGRGHGSRCWRGLPRSITSYRFAPATVSPMEMRFTSVSTLHFVPCLPRLMGFRPVVSPERRLRHSAVGRQPGPVNPFLRVVLRRRHRRDRRIENRPSGMGP
jgi:hypothetical protein